MKIQRELCFPKSAWKVSGNGPQVIKSIYSFDIIKNQSRQTHSNTLLPSIRTKYCNITLTTWCLYYRGWINIIYLFIYSLMAQDLFLCVIKLWNFSTRSQFLYKLNSLVYSMCTTLDISSDLRVFVFLCIFESKSIARYSVGRNFRRTKAGLFLLYVF